MSLHSLDHTAEPASYSSTEPLDTNESTDERRATTRAGTVWHDARGAEDHPTLANLSVSGDMKEWHDRFLIRSDRHMPRSVFIACGEGVQSNWQMERLGCTLEDILPGELCDRFTDGCSESLATGSPVPIEGKYHDDESREVLFRCILMPVRAMNDKIDFIYGAYSQKR